MLQYIFDTDHLTLYDHGDATVLRHFFAHPLGAVGISDITVGEYLRGRLAVIFQHQTGPQAVQAYSRLIASLHLFAQFPIVPFDQNSDQQFQQLRRRRIRVGSRDLRIGAIALVNGLTVVTRNQRDFSRIPGLKLEDWSV